MTDCSVFTKKYEHSGRIGTWLVHRFLYRVARLIPQETKTILEVGCGPGYSTAYLSTARNDARWQASDVDPSLVAIAQTKVPNIPLSVESLYKLQRNDGSVDCVVCLEVLEHLDNPSKALKELSRVTRDAIVVSVPHEPIWRVLNMLRGAYLRDWGNTPGHLQHWSKRSFISFVAQEFAIEAVTTSLPWTIILGRKRS